jgi:WD40 repeat protein
MVASSSGDKTARLWDVRTGDLRMTLTGHGDWVTHVSFSPDGKILATTCHDEPMRLWTIATGKSRIMPTQQIVGGGSIAFSPDGKTLAIGGNDIVELWDISESGGEEV